jgi:hypothetical protein
MHTKPPQQAALLVPVDLWANRVQRVGGWVGGQGQGEHCRV